jgi:hypothetical protein
MARVQAARGCSPFKSNYRFSAPAIIVVALGQWSYFCPFFATSGFHGLNGGGFGWEGIAEAQ